MGQENLVTLIQSLLTRTLVTGGKHLIRFFSLNLERNLRNFEMIIPSVTTLIGKVFLSTKIHIFFSFIYFHEVTILIFLRENLSRIGDKFELFQTLGSKM